MEQEIEARFKETSACKDCEWLEDCRKNQKPRRTSCWILRVREYWRPQLGDEKRK